MKLINILISLLISSTPCMAAAVDPLNQNDPNFLSVLNDDLQKINGQQILLATSYPVSRLSGTITTAQGGTSADLSAATQGAVPYFSATGVMSALPPGVAGQVLTSGGPSANDSWTSLGGDYAAGDNLILGPSAILTAPGTSYTKVLEVKLPRSGTLRIKFGLNRKGGIAGPDGRIYRNGVAVGTVHNNSTTTWTEYSEDISGWTKGDLLQLYLLNEDGAFLDGLGGALRIYELTPITETFTSGGIGKGPGPLTYAGSDTPTVLGINALGSIGDFYINTAGGASTTLYVKTGASTWTAK